MQPQLPHLAMMVMSRTGGGGLSAGDGVILTPPPVAPFLTALVSSLLRCPALIDVIGCGLQVRLDQAPQLGQVPVTLGHLAPQAPDLVHGAVHYSPASRSGPFSTRLTLRLTVLPRPGGLALISHCSHRQPRARDSPPQPGASQMHPVVITRPPRAAASKWPGSSTAHAACRAAA